MGLMKAALYDGAVMQVSEMPRPAAQVGTVGRARARGPASVVLTSVFCVHGTSQSRLRVATKWLVKSAKLVPGLRAGRSATESLLDTICQGRGCGQCSYCLAGQYLHCSNKESAENSGGFAEYIQRKALGLPPYPGRAIVG